MSEARASVMAEGMQVTKAVTLRTPLSAGGMGEVWLADHQGLKTRVVVKFMLGGLDSNDSARTRFSREAAAAAQVKSPHVVQMLDHGVTDAGVPFIVMEYLEGHDLGDEIKSRGAIEPAKVILIVAQIAKALTKVHAAGLLHRDIKPDNIFLCDGEEDVFAKLLDFGVAKSNVVGQGDAALVMDGETKTGQIVGTPYYMSPEQVTAQKSIDHRSDLWALGVVAYEALTGTKPYDGPSFGALAVRIATGSPPRPSGVNSALPPSVDEWFAKACARNAAERFASAKEMAEALRAAFEGVVSLPARVSSGDSGERGAGSQPSRTEVERIGFAATSPDSSDGLKPALARSEAGVSFADVRGATAPSPLVKFGIPIAAVLLVVGGFSYLSKRGPTEVKERIAASSTPVATAAPSAVPMTTPSSLPSAGAGIAVAVPSASLRVDAGAAPSVPSVAVTRGRPIIKPAGAASAAPSAKPASDPAPKPTPTNNASTDPLY